VHCPSITLLEAFRPVFTAPTWKKLLALLRGTLLTHVRRTVTAALWHTGHGQDLHFSAFHQVLNRARWRSSSAPWIVEPLLGTLALWSVHRLGNLLYNGPTGLLALILGALSGFYIYLAASYLSHAVALFFAWR
jgi:hypothetical protein